MKLRKYYAENICETTGVKIKINIGVVKENFQWKVFLLDIFQFKLMVVEMKKYQIFINI